MYPHLIFIFRIIIAISLAIIAIGGMMSYLFPYIKTPRKPLKEKGIIKMLYLNSEKIITQLYYLFFIIYISFTLEHISILFNHLMLLFIGLFLGYKATMKASEYTASKKNGAKKRFSQ